MTTMLPNKINIARYTYLLLWFTIYKTITITITVDAAPGEVIHRINCGNYLPVATTTSTLVGGISHNTSTIWSADKFYMSGGMFNKCIVNDNIYCTSRYFKVTRGTPFSYRIQVPYTNTYYQVKLHFAEQVSVGTTVKQ
jgi:hypothetical protein